MSKGFETDQSIDAQAKLSAKNKKLKRDIDFIPLQSLEEIVSRLTSVGRICIHAIEDSAFIRKSPRK